MSTVKQCLSVGKQAIYGDVKYHIRPLFNSEKIVVQIAEHLELNQSKINPVTSLHFRPALSTCLEIQMFGEYSGPTRLM